MNLEVLKPFGPSIVKLELPNEIIDEMNKYTDDIIKDKNKLKNLDHGSKLAGNVHQEILLDLDFMKKIQWAEFLGTACEQWIKQENNKQLKNFKIIKSWIVRQFKYDYNPIHFHSGHISGVGYLKVPNELGNKTQKGKKDYGRTAATIFRAEEIFTHLSRAMRNKYLCASYRTTRWQYRLFVIL